MHMLSQLAGARKSVLTSAVRDPFTLAEEKQLFNFATELDLKRWQTFQDKDVGGKSTVTLDQSLDNPVILFGSAGAATYVQTPVVPWFVTCANMQGTQHESLCAGHCSDVGLLFYRD